MGDGYSRAPFLLKGALLQFGGFPIIPLPIPQVIIFQYNPESMSRSLTTFAKDEQESALQKKLTAKDAKLDMGFDPEETFNVTLFLDGTDHLESENPITLLTGVADRMAALELLLYPEGDGLLKGLLSSLVTSIGGASVDPKKLISPGKVPITLFIWGPGRIVPVRLTSFNVEETWWNSLLYPLRAKVTIGMKVIHSNEFANDPRVPAQIARVCYDFTRAQKEILAALNIANTVESVGDIVKSIPM
jgi:hypothetical protein